VYYFVYITKLDWELVAKSTRILTPGWHHFCKRNVCVEHNDAPQ